MPGDWKRNYYNFKHFRHPQHYNQPFQRPSNSKWQCSEELQRLFPTFPLIDSETFLQIEKEFLSVLIDTKAKLSVLNPTAIKQPLPESTKIVSIVESQMNLIVSETVIFV